MLEAIQDLSTLGPALGSVVVIGLLCWKLIQMFDRHLQTLSKISVNMETTNQTVDEMNKNISMNTEMTKNLLENNKMILNLLISKKT